MSGEELFLINCFSIFSSKEFIEEFSLEIDEIGSQLQGLDACAQKKRGFNRWELTLYIGFGSLLEDSEVLSFIKMKFCEFF